MDRKFSDHVKQCISLAREEAIRVKNQFIGPEHFILAIIKQGNNSALDILHELNININELKENIDRIISLNTEHLTDINITGSIPLTKISEKILKITYLEATIYKSEIIRTAHMLSSIIREEENIVSKLLAKQNINYESLKNVLNKYSKTINENETSTINIQQDQDTLSDPENLSQLKSILERSLISIQDHIEPAIGIKDIAVEIADLIINLKATDKGKMIGIFGNWGRGKTFLMNLVWEDINLKNNTYKKVDFHAWKYQDTPAVWAYLYESMSEAYYKSEYKWRFSRLVDRLYKVFKLNIIRNGYYNIASSSIILLGIVIITYSLYTYKPLIFSEGGEKFKGLLVAGFLIPVSIAGIKLLKSIVKSTYLSANTLFKQYSDKKSFFFLTRNSSRSTKGNKSAS
ncbi:hypothetical protein J0X19_03425 [Hymenobacter sp. BT186]|uniref:Clp R domain-containing protein n=1 Tax=Hymenobacter telluris TaxID=2816474 RepID=A0A939ESI3_9BACT|nr:Clp protease N-terminal domain-containing protein [Hymenobacter telluris]MBO0356984.1 hypothetical protein [Hymenobacter telluris]MBW3373011.1 hypothetical protein [Hymenobacter norwichensis]